MSSAIRPGEGRYLRDGGASARAGSGFRPSFSLSEAKLHRPVPRPGMVHRARLVGRLMAEPRPSTISITAPPGYGKTVLLADWAAREERSTGWLTLDDLDNDPSVFVAYLAVAIDRISPIDPALMSAIAAPPDRLLAAAVPRLASELYRLERPALLILDDVHRLVDRACLDALGQLLEHLPPDVQVAMAGRTRPDLPFGRLRAHRDLLEIGRRQLAFDEVETRELTSAVGRHLTADQAARLTERTEGWAVAIYLATLADEVDGRQDHATDDVSGAEGHIADYLHSELSRGLADEDIALLTRTSILEAVEADAAGAVSALPDAHVRLRALARANLLIAEMGSPVGTYRYHRLLRDHLRAELERREPGVAPELHRRASSWYAAAGRTDLAIEHAFSSGDPDGTARLIEGAALSMYRGGHGDRLDRWMRSFDDAAFAHRPSLAVIGGWLHALDGRAEAAERMAAIVERSATGTLPADGSASFESARAMLRAAMAHRGPEDLLANATLATTAEGPGSPWRSTALMLLGWGHALLGDGERADAAFSDAVDAASTGDSATYLPLAGRASLAIGRGDWEAGERYVTDSHARMEGAYLEGGAPALLVHGVAARVAIHRGEAARGREELVHAQLVRPLASYALPWASVGGLLEVARAYLAIADPAGARSVVSEAERIVRRRPDLGVLTASLRELRRRLDESVRTIGGPSTLTPAELRLLPMLSTYLPFEEIGERLHVSRHTVHSQSQSIYAKLGVSSRSEAVGRAIEIGLLEPFPGLRLTGGPTGA